MRCPTINRLVSTVGRRARVGDALLWFVLVLPVLVQAVVAAVADAPWWHLLLGALLLAAVVAAGRDHPVGALPVSAGLYALDPSFLWAVPAMSYLAGRRSARPIAALLGFGGIALAGSVLYLSIVRDAGQWVQFLVGLAFLGVAPWLVGRYRRQYVALVHAGWERAEHLEREQRSTAEQARLRERARIAQDMHDSLGHELSLIALGAGALELAAELDERHRTTAGELRERAGKASEQLREVIGVLRQGTEDASHQVLDTVDGLVERTRHSGVTVRLEQEGEVEPPPMVGRAAYRVVQESLTNAVRHAPGSGVTVWLRHAPGRTVVFVANSSSGQPVPESTGGGHGLVGLRERVRLLGGTLHARELSTGFEVRAELPHAAGESLTDGEPDTTWSESTRQREDARRRARRSLLTAVTVTAAMGAGVLAGQGFVWWYNADRAELEPSRYAEIEVGQQRAEIAHLLPPAQLTGSPPQPEPPKPDSASCRYYGSNSNVLHWGYEVYRLCFDRGRLVSKDVLRT